MQAVNGGGGWSKDAKIVAVKNKSAHPPVRR